MPRPSLKHIEDLNEVERRLFDMAPKFLQGVETLLTLRDQDRQFFRYRYIDRLPVADIPEKIFCGQNLFYIRKRVLLECKQAIFS